MGLRFRKSINLGGGVKLNLSKSGVGYSFGGKGYRFTKKAGGGTRTTASIPGTGISWVKDTKSMGCLASMIYYPLLLCWWIICVSFWLMWQMCYWFVKLFFVLPIKWLIKHIKSRQQASCEVTTQSTPEIEEENNTVE